MQEGPGSELLFGLHPVLEALRARRRRMLRLLIRADLTRPELRELEELADAAGIPVQRVSREQLEATLPDSARDQGLVLEAGPLPAPSLEEICVREIEYAAGGGADVQRAATRIVSKLLARPMTVLREHGGHQDLESISGAMRLLFKTEPGAELSSKLS